MFIRNTFEFDYLFWGVLRIVLRHILLTPTSGCLFVLVFSGRTLRWRAWEFKQVNYVAEEFTAVKVVEVQLDLIK